MNNLYDKLKEYLSSDTAKNSYNYFISFAGVSECISLPLLVLVLGAFHAVELLDEISEAPTCRHYYSGFKDSIRFRVMVIPKSN